MSKWFQNLRHQSQNGKLIIKNIINLDVINIQFIKRFFNIMNHMFYDTFMLEHMHSGYYLMSYTCSL